MALPPRNLQFIVCSDVEGQPKPGETGSTTIRSHVMREYLRKNPRKKRIPPNDESSTGSSLSKKTRSSLKGKSDHQKNNLAWRHRDAIQDPSSHTATKGSDIVLRKPRYNYASIATISATHQVRVQIRDVFDRLFCAANPVYQLASIEGAVSQRSILPAAQQAGDALCLLQIAVARLDRNVLLQAMTCYQRALARMSLAIEKSAKSPQSQVDFMAAMFTLCMYEMIVRTESPGLGWVQHGRAIASLLHAGEQGARVPLNSSATMVTQESYFLTLHLGILSKQKMGYDLRSIRHVFPEGEFDISWAFFQVPDMLESLAALQTSECTSDLIGKSIATALRRYSHVEAELKAWSEACPIKTLFVTDVKNLPNFYATVEGDVCGHVAYVYEFHFAVPAIVHQTAWMAQFHLLDAILPLVDCVVPQELALHPTARDIHSRHDFYEFLSSNLHRLAQNVLYTLPFMFETMGGCGRAIAWGPVQLLLEFYQRDPLKPQNALHIKFLERIKQKLLPGFIVQRLLSA
ncbi:hypothetical protein MRB53_037725 [Persea americana]|nr:hypothetical protein MRB53_037725 [Persea americana]